MNGSAGAFFLRALGCCRGVSPIIGTVQTNVKIGIGWIHLGGIRRGPGFP